MHQVSTMRMLLSLVILSVILTGGCARVSGFVGMEEPLGEYTGTQEQHEAGSRAYYEQQLQATLQAYIQAEENTGDQNQVIRRRPYFLKEYSEYPNGLQGASITIHETDSVTSPYTAEVTIPKVRYATQMHRSRGDAQADNNFLRDTGTETLNFELRGGNWIRVGGLFVPDRTEEFVNGGWEDVVREVERRADPDYAPGWFERTWRRIPGL